MDSNPLGSDCLDNRSSEHLFEFVPLDLDPFLGSLIYHVKHQHKGDTELGEQGGEGERAFQVLGIADLNNQTRFLIDENFARNTLIVFIGKEIVDARRVNYFNVIAIYSQLSALYFDT